MRNGCNHIGYTQSVTLQNGCHASIARILIQGSLLANDDHEINVEYSEKKIQTKMKYLNVNSI